MSHTTPIDRSGFVRGHLWLDKFHQSADALANFHYAGERRTHLIIIACLEAVALIAVVALLLRHFNQAEKAWTVERRELVNRVQKPELIPVQPVERFEIPERQPDEWGKVGQIEISDAWMNGDDG